MNCKYSGRTLQLVTERDSLKYYSSCPFTVMMQPAIVISNRHYLRVSIEPPTSDVLTIRKSTSDALAQTFGQTSATTYLDILWINDEGSSAVIRVHKERVFFLSALHFSFMTTDV